MQLYRGAAVPQHRHGAPVLHGLKGDAVGGYEAVVHSGGDVSIDSIILTLGDEKYQVKK